MVDTDSHDTGPPADSRPAVFLTGSRVPAGRFTDRGLGLAEAIRIVPESQVLERDRSITVPVLFAVHDPGAVQSIIVAFHGYVTTKAMGKLAPPGVGGVTGLVPRPVKQRRKFVGRNTLLKGQPLRAMLDASASAHSPSGEPAAYQLDATVQIPAGAPPSLEGEKVQVAYTLAARVSLARQRDLDTEHSFRVLAELPPFRGPATARWPDDLGDHGLTAYLELEDNTVKPHEPIRGSLRITSEKERRIEAVTGRLVGIENAVVRKGRQAYQSSHRRSSSPVEILNPGAVHGHYTGQFEALLEVDGPPTARDQGFQVAWRFEATISLPRARDPQLAATVIRLSD